MTRRDFMLGLLSGYQGRELARLERDASVTEGETPHAEGFELKGMLTADQSGPGSYAIGIRTALVLAPDSALVASTDALRNATVILSLKRA